MSLRDKIRSAGIHFVGKQFSHRVTKVLDHKTPEENGIFLYNAVRILKIFGGHFGLSIDMFTEI